ncbi:RAC family serine/threonine-protein kinase like protein [Tritrichomonas foetus]|uniref:RAC family serine/threonine-protein kinase like protein n=1 Tax=Tritrichomonas foetus TaxID=1144522 RepID=A0A1J4KHG7_9EUKA|nr:RAC family serine/threonine-protein kinase like protein [Tritrichomonas foetus]|eukprot:OHT10643.1 RAC family serine/threonine-protein kinase like protein [Tritrichomonas foetus]
MFNLNCTKMEDLPLLFSDILSLEGELDVRDSPQSPWRKSFCRIIDATLELFEDDIAASPFVTIQINSSITVEFDDDSKGKNNSFYFHVEKDNEFFYGFYAEKIEEARRWVDIIRALTMPQLKVTMDDFNIISVLGRGFLGKVMLVEHKETKEMYAIKSVQKKKLIESGRPHTIIAERNIMMLIKNPFIIQLHFAFQTPTKFYLGLEYAPGGELFYHMEHIGLIPVDDARLYVAEISIALEHLHKYGIVYRDLKPENVLLDAQGHVKLTDFGLAKDLCEVQNTSTFCGTNHYLAPEIIRNEPYSYEIDWWALGILLCEMLTGVTPFDGESRAKMFDSITQDEPMLPTDIDNDAGDLILKLLTKNPKERPSFEDIAAHKFFECLDWELVVDRRYVPNFVPEEIERPTMYFPPEFTQEDAIDSTIESYPAEDNMNVTGFSFFAPNVMDDGAKEVDMDVMDTDMLEEYQKLGETEL